MKLLLDTHTFLWAAISPRKSSARARSVLIDLDNEVAVSSLSFWEISLQLSLGKIALEGCTPDELPAVRTQRASPGGGRTVRGRRSLAPGGRLPSPLQALRMREGVEQVDGECVGCLLDVGHPPPPQPLRPYTT